MEGCKVTYIPANPGIELSETVLFYMLSLVPEGKLTRDEDIENYLAKKLNTHRVIFKRDLVFNNDFIKENLSHRDTYFRVPQHRKVSSRGLVDKRYAEDLEREGFLLVESKVSRYSMRVINYKDALFNYEEANIDMDVIRKVNEIGLSVLTSK
jgi:hypothetical protein